MINLRRTLIILGVILIISIGILMGFLLYDAEAVGEESVERNNDVITIEDQNIQVIETSIEEEKTTPHTLIIYKTYYTDCKHYIKRYEDIDASMVNLTEKEFKEKNRGWRLDKFSSSEIEVSKEVEAFCNEHYKLKLENKVIVIYKIDEEGRETEYEQTGITTEYLTTEDILKLTSGIEVYGRENLTSTIEDYE